MANLLASLSITAGALDAYSRVLDVTQNNVSNASTPGYAKQSQSLYAMPFDPVFGSIGGVRAGDVRSTRDEYAEQAVRQQTNLLGDSQQSVNGFTALQSLFDVSGSSGIAGALNGLFESFSSWAQTPASGIARQTVLDRAAGVATAFNQTSAGLTQLAQDTDQQLHQTVDEVNRLVGELGGMNAQIMRSSSHNAGIDAQVHDTLEELAQHIGFTSTVQGDGTVTVLLDGQVPLLIGDQQYSIRAAQVAPDPLTAGFPAAPPTSSILNSEGKDVTAHANTGQLGSLLNLANNVLPGYRGSSTQAGGLNQMATQFATRVNNLFTSGTASDGPPPVSGVPLFTFDTVNATTAAISLTVDPSVTQDQLAATTQGPPYLANGVPLALSRLFNPQSADDQIDGASFMEFYGSLAARAGVKLEQAQNDLLMRQSSVAQAQTLRRQVSGVSLDEEATILIQFQRAYEANSQLISVLNKLTEDTINILR